MSRRCYCCGQKRVEGEYYYCLACLQKLEQVFRTNGAGIVAAPTHQEHCISCGQWEDRRMLWTGRTNVFDHTGDGVPICEKCVTEELAEYR